MSYDRNYHRTTTTSSRNNRRPLYAPPPPPGSGYNRHHSVLGYWVPLITIGTIAVGGLAAWIWSERSEHDEDDYPPGKPQRPPTGMGAPYPTQGSQPYPGQSYPPNGPPGSMPPPVGSQQQQQPPYRPTPGGEASSYYRMTETETETTETRQTEQQEDGTFFGRVSGAMRRAPSPQQFFDNASRQVTAGMAAAGAAAGAALSSIMEEDRNGQAYGEAHEEREGFSDHERWSEEADELRRVNMVSADGGPRTDGALNTRDGKGKAKRTVAVVVTADIDVQSTGDDSAYHTEHGSILSHLPAQHDPNQTNLFVLIYAPGLKSLPSVDYQPGRAPSTLGSFSQISTPAVTPGSELQSISPRIDATEPATKHFEVLYNQALSLVSHPTQILPFTTPDGYVHMLRHLAPQLVYISDTLSGREGANVAQLKGWVGHTILVAGDDGHGGLADTETETEDERSGETTVKWRWYEHSSLVGLGKDIEVVDAARVGDDWSRRVFNKE